MKVYDLQCLLNAVPQDFDVLLNYDYPINEIAIAINYDAEELSVIVPEVLEEDEGEEYE